MTHLTVYFCAPDLPERYISTPLAASPKYAVPGHAGAFALGNLTAAARLSDLSPDHALAQQLNFIDPDIIAEPIIFASPQGHEDGRGYLLRPAVKGAAFADRHAWKCRRSRKPRPDPPVSKISPIVSPSTSSKPAAARRAAPASPALLWRCSGQCRRRCRPRYRPCSPSSMAARSARRMHPA